MKPQNELALIVAYYLSRLDKESYGRLGYKTFNETARKIGTILNVKATTIKNMRDEFDHHLQNSRIGWKRELRGSRLKVFQTLQMTEDDELLEIVKEIIENSDFISSSAYKDIEALLKAGEKAQNQAKVFVPRGPTGKKAENAYIDLFHKRAIPAAGQLIDCRDMGCGYDFEIRTHEGDSVLIEVKGLAKADGGILFTDKEWQQAKKHRKNYYLILISNIDKKPTLRIVQDPVAQLAPKRTIYTSIQVGWSVAKGKMQNIELEF